MVGALWIRPQAIFRHVFYRVIVRSGTFYHPKRRRFMRTSVKVALAVLGIAITSAIGTIATHMVRAATTTNEVTVATTGTTSSTTAPTPTMKGDHGLQRLAEMATLLGMTESDLQTQLENGTPFYQIAAAHGITYDKVKANAETQYKATLDDMVKVGYLTQAEADSFLQQYQTNTQQNPDLGMMGMGHGFGHGMR